MKPGRLLLLALVGGGLATLVASCGDKIAIPQAVGIPTNSDYLLDRTWDLDQPTDVIESLGFLFVTEAGAGAVTKYSTDGAATAEATGLTNPAALAGVGSAQIPDQFILVAEAGGATPPAINVYSRDLFLIDRIDLSGLVLSISSLTAHHADWVYLSDPDSGVVHRFLWTGEDNGWLSPSGLVTRRIANNESPQFVSAPRGLAIDGEGMLLVCDADTTRNWVVRFDPTANPAPNGLGTLRAFRDLECPGTPALQSFVLGIATLCDETEVDPERRHGPGSLLAPDGAAIDTEGRIYVTDRLNNRGQRFGADGTFDITFARATSGVMDPLRVATWSGSVNTPRNTTIHISGARLFVIDEGRQQMLVYEDKRWTQLESGADQGKDPQ